jgi:hypothetical protein
LGTLLHEAAHGLAQARGVQDTSRQGRYHNRRYATLARELGLEVASVEPIGWSATTVPDTTAAAYAGQLQELQAALVLWRRHEHRSGAGPRSRNLLAATCGCERRIRVAKATLAEAPILCGPLLPAVPTRRSGRLTLSINSTRSLDCEPQPALDPRHPTARPWLHRRQ